VKTWASECTEECDAVSGHRVVRWTNSPAKDQHFYFTSPSVTADNRWLVFISERTGHPNIMAVDRQSGEIRQLSDNRAGLLKSYVYPLGGCEGLSKASPCLDETRGIVYYIQDNRVMAVEIASGCVRGLCALPAGWITGFNHVSSDGRYLGVPCASAGAFVDPAAGQGAQMWNVMARFYGGRHASRILRIDTRTGAWETWAEVPFWVTHVNFDPTSSDRLTFNQEGGPVVACRIWCLERDGRWRKLFNQGPDTHVNHENWAPEGGAVVFHGLRGGIPFVESRDWHGRVLRSSPVADMPGGHVTPGATPDEFITDGIGDLISLLRVDANSRVQVSTLCRHGSRAAEQDTHAHPLLGPDRRSVVFTSDRAGLADVYEVFL